MTEGDKDTTSPEGWRLYGAKHTGKHGQRGSETDGQAGYEIGKRRVNARGAHKRRKKTCHIEAAEH